MQFEFYVLNYNHNKQKVEMFNIFQNIHVQEYTEKAIKKYLRSPKNYSYKPFNKDEEVIYGFNALVREIDSSTCDNCDGCKEENHHFGLTLWENNLKFDYVSRIKNLIIEPSSECIKINFCPWYNGSVVKTKKLSFYNELTCMFRGRVNPPSAYLSYAAYGRSIAG